MTESELEAAVLSRPSDDAPRLELAALLRAKGDPRGEFIALQLDMARIRSSADVGATRWLPLWERAEALRRKNGDAWLPALPDVAGSPVFARGFVEEVTVPAAALARAGDLVAVAPIRRLSISAIGADREQLFAKPILARMISLDLFGLRLGDAGAVALARSPHLHQLVWLDLSNNDIGRAGLDAILASPRLPRLRYLGFRANAVESPVEGFGVDGGIVSTGPSQATLEAEARFGYKAWLHAPSLHPNAYPPGPEDLDQP
jgi:uncharacterized protein (TIGR02996 family)